MAKSRKFLTASAIGVAAFALIGAGASATFQDNVTAQQSITAGTMNMTIAGSGGWSEPGGKTLTLPAFGPVNSTFTTPAQTVIVTNNGNIAANMVKLVVSAPTNGNTALRDGLKVKIGALGDSAIYDGPLTGLQSAADAGILVMTLPQKTIAAGASWTGQVTFYADDLPNGAQGAVVVPTLTVKFEG